MKRCPRAFFPYDVEVLKKRGAQQRAARERAASPASRPSP
jgi:hypothetical protein